MAISQYTRNKDVPVTLKDLVRRSVDPLWKTKSCHKAAISNLCDAVEILDNPRLSELTTEDIDHYTEVLGAHVKPATVNRKLCNLHTILKYARDRGWIESIPKFTWQSEDNLRIRWLSPEEEVQLLSLLPQPFAAFCEILIQTGMRRGELMNLKREQIDGDYIRLWVTKTKEPRSVPMTDRVKELVDQYVPFNFKLSQLRTAWEKAKREMGLAEDPNFVLHMLRHTTATRLLATTSNLPVVQKVLGHRNIATTMRYAHVSDNTLLDAIRLTAKQHSTSPITA